MWDLWGWGTRKREMKWKYTIYPIKNVLTKQILLEYIVKRKAFSDKSKDFHVTYV